jgi:hypothetical protein
MKVLNRRWRVIALIPLVASAILAIGIRTGAVPDQNKEAREVGIIIQGGITHGETLRFNAFHLGEASCETHEQMLLTVFDSQGNVVVQQTWTTNPNQTFYFDLNADQLPRSSFDNNGRAELIGLLTHPGAVNSGGIPGGGCVVAGEVFDNITGQTLIHIPGTPITECHTGAVTYSLKVNHSGNGGGTVTSTPAPGIACGATCSVIYDSFTVVDLVATPNSGSTFSGWSGDCAGTGACTLRMDSNKSVTATFKR